MQLGKKMVKETKRKAEILELAHKKAKKTMEIIGSTEDEPAPSNTTLKSTAANSTKSAILAGTQTMV